MSDMNADPPRQNAFSGGRGGVGHKKVHFKMPLSRFQCDIQAHYYPYISNTGGYVYPKWKPLGTLETVCGILEPSSESMK
jgi:hypothetical protein